MQNSSRPRQTDFRPYGARPSPFFFRTKALPEARLAGAYEHRCYDQGERDLFPPSARLAVGNLHENASTLRHRTLVRYDVDLSP
jgi:hypothetical protein